MQIFFAKTVHFLDITNAFFPCQLHESFRALELFPNLEAWILYVNKKRIILGPFVSYMNQF